MELHQLRYFVAVADTGSFRQAARHCHVAQPSLSQQIIKLEKELDRKLFDRLGRATALTEAGRALLPRARSILAEVREARREVAEDIATGCGKLAVGAIPTVAPFLLPGAIERFAHEQPKAELSVREEFTDDLVTSLVAAEVEMAFLSLPIHSDQVEVEELLMDPLLAVVARGHDLAKAGFLKLRDLDDQPAVVLHEMHCLAEQVESFCHGHRVRQQILCRTTQLSTVQSLVALGLGISLVPHMCAVADTSSERVYLPLQASPSRTIVAAWHAGRSRSHLAERFLEEVRVECRRLASLHREAG